MQNRSGIQFLVFLCYLILLCSSPTLAALPDGLTTAPEEIVLHLPRDLGQEYQVSLTLNPMKIIVDSNGPLQGFADSMQVGDVALRAVRYTVTKDGGSRLVLDFNYQVPEPVVTQTAESLKVEIAKTYVDTSERMVIPGVIYGHQRRADSFGPNVVNFILIDTKRADLSVRLALSQNRVFGSEHVSTMAERLGAIAAVNGAYFSGDGRPLGLFMIDGELISEPYASRTALGIGPDLLLMERVTLGGVVLWPDGSPLAEVSGLNRLRLQDDLIVYTHRYGSQTKTNAFGHEITVIDGVVTHIQAGNSTVPVNGVVLSGHGVNKHLLSSLAVGDELDIQLDLTPPWIELGVQQIIGGGPRLVRDGQLFLTGEDERFRDDVLKGRAPRTALGITEDEKLILVTVNGRQPNISVGMTLSELGYLLIELGAVQAMNLDGGGSTTMVIRNLVLNLPSDGKERPVSNAIVILPLQK